LTSCFIIGFLTDLPYFVFEPIAGSVNDDYVAFVEQAIQYSRRDSIVAKYLAPLVKRFVGGNDDRASFIPVADDLKEQVGPFRVDRHVTEFVANEEVQAGERHEFICQ